MHATWTWSRAIRLSCIVAAVVLGACEKKPATVVQPESPDALKAKAEQGDAKAQCSLGDRYANGDGVAKDAAEAVKWFTKAAEQGSAEAEYNLSIMYAKGAGVAKDQTVAGMWFTKAAHQGRAFVFTNLLTRVGGRVEKGETEEVAWWTKAAEEGVAQAQYLLGRIYESSSVVPQDNAKAVKWLTKAAEQGDADAQYHLGDKYCYGAEAMKWLTKAAERGNEFAQNNLGRKYDEGKGVPKNDSEAVKWFTMAAEQGYADAQDSLGVKYALGEGVPKDAVQAYAWFNLAAAQGDDNAAKNREKTQERMTPAQIAEAQRISAAFKPKNGEAEQAIATSAAPSQETTVCGSGFFITSDGYFVTNRHVVADARRLRVRTASGIYPAEVVRVDAPNDLALLKLTGTFPALHVRGSTGVQTADRVCTVGYPNPALQGLAAKFSSGEVAAITGPADDPTLFQISVSIQPGNSGGPLFDASGSVVGVVVAQLDKVKTLKITGSLPENVN